MGFFYFTQIDFFNFQKSRNFEFLFLRFCVLDFCRLRDLPIENATRLQSRILRRTAASISKGLYLAPHVGVIDWEDCCQLRGSVVVMHYLREAADPVPPVRDRSLRRSSTAAVSFGYVHMAAEGGAGSGGEPDVRGREKTSRIKLLC